MLRYNRFNAKRRIAAPETYSQSDLDTLADAVSYSGNPEHKKSPGDFNLDPSACARLGKTLCDDTGIFHRKDALELLRKGLKRGAVSEKVVDEWPKQIWAIADNGAVLEAQRAMAPVAIMGIRYLQATRFTTSSSSFGNWNDDWILFQYRLVCRARC